MAAPYVPLRVFTCYSMLEGAIEPKAIPAHARRLHFPAVAIADRNGLYAAMPFTAACLEAGVQPIIGTLLGVARPEAEGAPAVIDWLALYAQDERGYSNLCSLVSEAHLGRPLEIQPHVAFGALAGRTDGLLALTAGAEGALARLAADRQADALDRMAECLAELFPDRLYVELSRRGDPVEEAAEGTLLDLAFARGLPLVATNPALYAEAAFHRAHDAMLCIAQGTQLEREDREVSSPEAWLKPAANMRELFADLPESVENSAVIARRCAFGAPQRRPILPRTAADADEEAEQLRRDARAGLEKRLSNYDKAALEEGFPTYADRLEFELETIISMGFPGYFLIVADFIVWAKEHGIPVGPGRGSGAGSLVAWALTITDLDPIRLGLLFERFLNPDRVSMPDFDVDFCETRRGEVIHYVQQRWGADRVAQIITFGKLKARAVLKDTGRVLQMPYGQVDRLAKLIPNHPTDPWTLERALGRGRNKNGAPQSAVPELIAEYESDADVRRLFDLAMKLEGLPRHSSTHAAGVVIADRPLEQLVPLYRDPRSDLPVTQFDMKYVEAAGLVKFDFLGLKTLSVLRRGVELLAERGIHVDLDQLPWDDEHVYSLLQRGDTVGVFQLESEGMRRTLAAVKPDSFGDIVALVSLYRPGPMDHIPMFGARKNGREPIHYPHPLLETVLAETYGIFVYQEQVMEAARVLAGFSLGEADLLRRAMGKKIRSEMEAQRARFVEGCAVNDIGTVKATELFALIEKFAEYGFNKSHAAAYALVAYQTAWLKAHHPVVFYAASMSFDISQTDKLAVFVEDMRRLGIACLPTSINASEAEFAVDEDGEGNFAVRYALGALKNVGEKAMAQLVEERRARGPFRDLDDFAARIDPRLLNRRQIESLAGAGAFDGIADRAAVFAAAETILAAAASALDARESGQGGLFGEGPANIVPIRMPSAEGWTLAQRMTQEKESFGFYYSAHPVDDYRHLADAHGARSFAELSGLPPAPDGARSSAAMAALVEEVRWRTSARGRRYMVATLSDASGQFEAFLFDDEAGEQAAAAAKSGKCVLLNVELDRRAGEETPRVTIRSLQGLDSLARRSRLQLEIEAADPAALPALAALLAGRRGGNGQLLLHARFEEGGAEIVLGRDFVIDAELALEIGRIDGIGEAGLSVLEPPRLALVS